jgi:hypothetical protein
MPWHWALSPTSLTGVLVHDPGFRLDPQGVSDRTMSHNLTDEAQ